MSEKGRWNGLPTLIIGASGQSLVVKSIIESINESSGNRVYNILGAIEKSREFQSTITEILPVVTFDDELKAFLEGVYGNCACFISLGSPNLRKNIVSFLTGIQKVVTPNLIHPSVYGSDEAWNGSQGTIIGDRVSLSPLVSIGNYCMVQRNCSIGHQTVISDFCVLNPGVIIGGNVIIESEVLIGSGAIILQNLKIGKGSTVGSGAVVTKDVPPGQTVVGVPAKRVAEAK